MKLVLTANTPLADIETSTVKDLKLVTKHDPRFKDCKRKDDFVSLAVIICNEMLNEEIPAVLQDGDKAKPAKTVTMPECSTKGCTYLVNTITDSACPACQEAHTAVKHVVCQQCNRTVPEDTCYKLGNDYICKNDDGTCHKDVATQVKRQTAAVNTANAAKKTTSKKSSGPKKPTSRQIVLDYIDDLDSFTVAEIAELLSTNPNNASTTINLLITRPSKNVGAIPFHRSGKGEYSRNADVVETYTNNEGTFDKATDNVVDIHECPICGDTYPAKDGVDGTHLFNDGVDKTMVCPKCVANDK